ncbi:MAG: M6 family metalloprotease domain-containing protein [Candidatus Zixiibacteriota bacterium]
MRYRIVATFALTLLLSLTWHLDTFGVALTREVVEKLQKEGKLQEWVDRWESAARRGMYDTTPDQLLRLAKVRSKDFAQPETLRPLVLLVDFSDNVHSQTPDTFATLLFSEGFVFPTGSFRDYHLENSYGQHDPQGGVHGWVTMDLSYAYYVAGAQGFGSYPRNARGLVEDALAAADPYINFQDYDYDNNGWIDGLMVVHAGPGAEETGSKDDIWSHRWSIGAQERDGVWISSYTMQPETHANSSLIDIGVFCHEWGHELGIHWEEYDRTDQGYGLGDWSVMALGCYNNDGKKPAHHSAYCKYYLGWTNLVTVGSNLTDVEIIQAETSPVSYRLWTSGNVGHEFFMVENRQKTGFDSHLPGSGLLIYHVDVGEFDNDDEWCPGSPASPHYKTALEQADGKFQLEGCFGFGQNWGDIYDPFPGLLDKRAFDDTTMPSSRDYSDNPTQVAVWDISDSGPVMYANLDVTWSKPNLVVDDLFFNDSSGGDGDGNAEPEETVELYLVISNSWADLLNAGVVASADTEGIVFDVDSVGLGDILSGGTADNYGNPLEFTVAPGFPHKKVNFTFHVCGNGGAYCADIGKDANIGPPEVLLVDDDDYTDGGSNYVATYEKVLDLCGAVYDVWDKQAKPDGAIEFSDYPIIVWFTGDHRTSLLSPQDVTDLKDYLDGGGKLFLTSQDAAEKLSSGTASDQIFLSDYLHVSYGGGNERFLAVGVPGDPLADNLYTFFTGEVCAPGNQTSKDVVTPDTSASVIMKYALGFSVPIDSVAAVKYEGDFKVVFFGFGFEGMDSCGGDFMGGPLSAPKLVMERVLNWLREISHAGVVAFDNSSYSGTDDELLVTIVDPDLNLSPTESDTVSIRITSTTDKTGISILCTETDVSSGVFSGSCGFTTGLSDNLNDSIGVSDKDTVTAIYADENPQGERKDEAIWTEYVDTGPPTFTVGVLQNPVFSAELNIYTFPSESLKTAPTVTVGEDTLGVSEIYYEGETIYASTYELDASGTIQIKVVGTDLADNEGEHTETFAAGSISPSGGYVISHDNVLRLEVGSGALDRKEFLLVMIADKALSGNHVLDSYLETRPVASPIISLADGNQDIVSAAYSISPTELRLKAKAKLTFSYAGIDLEGRDQRGPIIHRLQQGIWMPIPSYLDPQKQQVVGFISSLGIYQLRYGDRERPEVAPRVHALSGSYPNPFNNSTSIRYEISSPGRVKIEIHNLLGQRVVTLVDDYRPTGRYATEWNGRSEENETVSSGIYFYSMRVGEFVQTRRMIFLK